MKTKVTVKLIPPPGRLKHFLQYFWVDVVHLVTSTLLVIGLGFLVVTNRPLPAVLGAAICAWGFMWVSRKLLDERFKRRMEQMKAEMEELQELIKDPKIKAQITQQLELLSKHENKQD